MRMLNSRRWMETKRIVWARADGLCEWCKRDGYLSAGVDCHHIVPFESAKTEAEMERLCYDPNNVVLLCIPCHVKTHTELRSKTKEKVKERRDQAFERWKDRLLQKNGDQCQTPTDATKSATSEECEPTASDPDYSH